MHSLVTTGGPQIVHLVLVCLGAAAAYGGALLLWLRRAGTREAFWLPLILLISGVLMILVAVASS